MAQAHGDRLSAQDASFLHQESASSHMHVGAVTIFEGPPPTYADFADHIRSRLHLVPRYRQKLAVPPLETGRPLWIDDPDFNLEYHVRHTALPSPGSEEQLRALAARVHSQQLDRKKPLWEMWLVQGLEGGRFALLTKAHHALVDGIAGVDLATVILDLTPVPAPVPHGGEPWAAQPEPTPAELAARVGATEEQVIESLEARTALRVASLDAPRDADDEDGGSWYEQAAVEDGFRVVDERSWLVPALQGLPERERLIIKLRFFDGLPQSAIAAQVGISQMHVSRLLARSLRALREAATE